MGSWNGRKVMVTGGEGFIGSNLVDLLLEEGADVRCLVHYNPGGTWGWLGAREDDVEILPGDVRDGERVMQAVEGRDVVLHLAALIGIPYSYGAPESYVQTNVLGTYNILNAARRHGTPRVVCTSTSEVYGTARTVPIDESHPLQPQSPYAATKVGADALAISFHRSFELPVAIIRPFNTYGPRQSTRAVIPMIIGQLFSDSPEVKLGALSPTRDFNYVEDTARGFLAVADADRALGEVVNVGTGREVSIGETVELLKEITGVDKPVVSDEERIRPGGSEVHRLLCDNTRAREWTGWEPRVSLEEGLRRTAEWVRANPGTLKTKKYHV
ncbi:MAG TPA: GDP-mannose 4,6-dehydratase [Actinomycetota bacterium]|nr:GDP-mannose 4,6-dehydratase [Actinomycetota bacterium]